MEHSSFLCELLSAYCVAITGQDLGCEQTKLNPVPGFPCGHSTIGASGRCAVTTCCMLGTVQTQREKTWHDHAPLPPFCLSAQGWESFHAQNYLPFAHSNCEEGPLLPICLMKKLSIGTPTQSHVCWKVEDLDQNSQLADARALIF